VLVEADDGILPRLACDQEGPIAGLHQQKLSRGLVQDGGQFTLGSRMPDHQLRRAFLMVSVAIRPHSDWAPKSNGYTLTPLPEGP
jgi:hypothetical protein